MTESSNYAAKSQPAPSSRKPIRIWVDGCFDMMHYGHANALRQAKEMGDYLVVGVHSDEEILQNKGPTVMKEQERYLSVAACKWVDEVVRAAPYVTSLQLMEQYNCDFCVHGDDIVLAADGQDSYAEVKAAGKFRECKRTASISTTELVGRMLLLTKEHHARTPEPHDQATSINSFASQSDLKSPYTCISSFFPTTRRIMQFANAKEPKPGDRIVYVDGDFDLFHVGHCELLRTAKAMGDYLLVGIHDDSTTNHVKGQNFPVMNLHERVLSVLSCKYVDEVIIGAPYSVTKELMEVAFNISAVVHGATEIVPDVCGADPYDYPRKVGKFHTITTEFSYLTASVIVDRIIGSRQLYAERNRKKQLKEAAMLKAQQLE